MLSVSWVFVIVIQQHQPQATKDQRPSVTNRPAVATGNSGIGKLRFQLLARQIILYCGSQRGTLDQVSLALFPLCFVVFAVVYWISYITESRQTSMAANIWVRDGHNFMQQWHGGWVFEWRFYPYINLITHNLLLKLRILEIVEFCCFFLLF